MYVFNEGVPRSGKSYDAVKTHVLPALAAGRKVYARINGLNHALIAAYLDKPLDEIQTLLVDVPTGRVKDTFCATQDDEGHWFIADDLKDALFVIDECHEFYVASRNAIDPRIEQFFALCGQNGMDGVLMSQWYRRLHSSVRARVERKNVFQKMTAVGLEKKYTLKQYHATEPDRFELVDTTVQTYDPKIFPLYQGYAVGADNTTVYKAGGTTVWRKLGKYGVVMGVVAALGFYEFWHFLHGGASGMVAKPQSHGDLAHVAAAPPTGAQVAVKSTVSSTSLGHGDFDKRGMPPEVQYVFDLSSQGRARLAGVVQMPSKPDAGVVEWSQDGGAVIDRMTFDQIRDLGVAVQVHRYGVKLTWQKQSIIVTPWPLDMLSQSQQTLAGSSEPASSVSGRRSSDSQDSGVSDVQPWPTSALASNYTPPQLEKRPEYTPNALQ
jgi:zona occludens toxin